MLYLLLLLICFFLLHKYLAILCDQKIIMMFAVTFVRRLYFTIIDYIFIASVREMIIVTSL